MKISYTSNKNLAHVVINGSEQIFFRGSQDFNLHDGRFALLAVCPIAMSRKENIYCDFFVDKRYLELIQDICFHWSLICPEIYSFPNIKVKDGSISSDLGQKKNLIFFSGGVDSHYTSVKKFDQGIVADCLTVQGMDYKVNDDKKFEALLKLTAPFREHYFSNTITVKTNLHDFYREKCNPQDGSVTHFFNLVSCALLYDYQNIFMASDYSVSQQNIAHPYGSNTGIFNKLKNLNQNFILSDDDVTRSEKIEFLIRRETFDFKSLSICTDYSLRPHNCGVCSKCLRTKVCFFALTGQVPEIFLNKEITKNWIKNLNLKRKNQIAHVMDALNCIRKSKYQDKLEFKNTLDYFLNKIFKQRRITSKINGLEKNIFRNILSRIKKKFIF